MRLKKTTDSLEAFCLSLTRYTNGVGVFFLAMMMLITAVDVFLRYFFNSPITGSIEITSFTLVLTILLGISYATARRQHVTIDILSSQFPPRVRLVTDSIINLLALVLSVLIVWRTIEQAIIKAEMNRVTTVLQIPISPFILVAAFGFALSGFVLCVHLVQNLDQGV